jgi:MraZ protein
MLTGKFYNSIDSKSRMVIPAKHREDLGLKCVVTEGIDKCLYIYPMSSWERFTEKLSRLPISDPQARAFVRKFNSSVVECDIDRQGRITLTQELREYAGIEKDLVTVGVMDKIEVWSKQAWTEIDNSESAQGDFAQRMTEYGI